MREVAGGRLAEGGHSREGGRGNCLKIKLKETPVGGGGGGGDALCPRGSDKLRSGIGRECMRRQRRRRRRQAVDVAVDRTRRQVVDRHAGNKIQYFIKTHVTHTQRVLPLC